MHIVLGMWRDSAHDNRDSLRTIRNEIRLVSKGHDLSVPLFTSVRRSVEFYG